MLVCVLVLSGLVSLALVGGGGRGGRGGGFGDVLVLLVPKLRRVRFINACIFKKETAHMSIVAPMVWG